MTKKIKHIEVLPYNPKWPEQFVLEAEAIKNALGNNCLAVHHVGSTSVPNLIAKPQIDIIAVVDHAKLSIEPLEKIGFEYRGEFNIPMHYGFSKNHIVKVNLHLYEKGHPEIELNLTFRDYLRKHPEACKKYASLKEELLKEASSFEKNNSMFTGYNLGKNNFIHEVLEQAKFDRLRFVFCVHIKEKEAAQNFRDTYFFKGKDPYTWTFDHKDHVHFILYRGVSIIGYAHIQLWPKNRAAMRIIVIEPQERHKGCGAFFTHNIEIWLEQKGYESIHVEASPTALPFYEKLKYTAMPFNDPDGYEGDPQDTDMGKILKRS